MPPILTTRSRSATRPREIHFIYGTKATSELERQQILFLPRLMDLISASADPKVTLSLFLTGTGEGGRIENGKLPNRTFARRITTTDVVEALDGYDVGAKSARSRTVCYVCGPPAMTDEFVDSLSQQPGMARERVLCEKWW
ncbi:hypothetical protein LTR37_003983 [Vermiconidia calcicola]|uniref:Uncharacterized protein n=1 Tax=Vermiconidia calcicola TaxID=1690605 RepID=A0ACC3NNN5_9PEZI|nr:hypothetical protein LTR37_003983 [Vermiconidia calcicola]